MRNDGGRIFEQLPIASIPGMDDETLSFWTTPHGLNFSHAAALFQHGYERAETVVLPAVQPALESLIACCTVARLG